MKDCDKQLLDLYTELLEMEKKAKDAYSRDCEATNFTPCQIKYLQIIDSREKLTSSEFARIMQISKPTVSQLINRLSNADCVYKQHSAADKRICYIQLTPKGEKIARAEESARKEIVDYIESRLTPDELEMFISLLMKLI